MGVRFRAGLRLRVPDICSLLWARTKLEQGQGSQVRVRHIFGFFGFQFGVFVKGSGFLGQDFRLTRASMTERSADFPAV